MSQAGPLPAALCRYHTSSNIVCAGESSDLCRGNNYNKNMYSGRLVSTSCLSHSSMSGLSASSLCLLHQSPWVYAGCEYRPTQSKHQATHEQHDRLAIVVSVNPKPAHTPAGFTVKCNLHMGCRISDVARLALPSVLPTDRGPDTRSPRCS